MNKKIDLAQFVTPQFILSVLMLGIISYVVYRTLDTSPENVKTFSDDVRTMVITAVLVNGISELRKYWFNSNLESEKKNDTINNQASAIAAQAGTGTGTGNGNANPIVTLDKPTTVIPKQEG